MDAFPPKGVASEYSQMLFMHIPDTFEAQSCFLTGGWGPVMNCNMKGGVQGHWQWTLGSYWLQGEAHVEAFASVCCITLVGIGV